MFDPRRATNWANIGGRSRTIPQDTAPPHTKKRRPHRLAPNPSFARPNLRGGRPGNTARLLPHRITLGRGAPLTDAPTIFQNCSNNTLGGLHKCLHDRRQNRPNIDQCWHMLANTEPRSANFGHTWPAFSQGWPNLADVGQCFVEFGIRRIEITQTMLPFRGGPRPPPLPMRSAPCVSTITPLPFFATRPPPTSPPASFATCFLLGRLARFRHARPPSTSSATASGCSRRGVRLGDRRRCRVGDGSTAAWRTGRAPALLVHRSLARRR